MDSPRLAAIAPALCLEPDREVKPKAARIYLLVFEKVFIELVKKYS
jgi:hypothetical protein